MAEPYELREAEPEDLAWILELAEQLAELTVAPLRGVWGQKARDFARLSISQLVPLARTGGMRFLLAWDRSTQQRVGYLLLNLNHECPFEKREAYIEDMGVVSEYLGRRVGHFLTDEAARISAEAGIHFLSAHVSFSNRRALLAALGNGFELESYRIVRPCTELARQLVEQSEHALERQEHSEKIRRLVHSRRVKRRQRRS
jgi:ribosomal protein S18 acetylase RimI-like enzyme